MSLLLKVTHPLDFKLLLLSETFVFTSFGLFSFYGSALMVSDLLIEMPFRLSGCRFLHKCVLIGDRDLIIHHLNAPRLFFLDFDVLKSHLLDVGFELGFFKLEHLFFFLTLDLP